MNTQSALQTLQSEVDEFLTMQPGSAGEQRLLGNARNLFHQQPDLKTLFADRRPGQIAGEAAKRSFGIFDAEEATRMATVVAALVCVANESERARRLDLVMNAARMAATIDGLALAQYALMTFMVHHEEGRQLILPPFWQRYPFLLNRKPNRQIDSATECPAESKLNWFREDLFLNEHHQHWHTVYSEQHDANIRKDRRGELFLYMHQQMLARYNTERLAAGLPFVEPFPNNSFHDPLTEGYDPGLADFGWRKPQQPLVPAPGMTIDKLDEWRRELTSAVEQGCFIQKDGNPEPVDEDRLGNTIDAKGQSVNEARYGSIHDTVHFMIARLSPPFGVMASSHTATNDPLFYRWHRFIDDLSFQFQEKQKPTVIAADAPNVLIRSTKTAADDCSQSSDIILCRQEQIDAVRLCGEDDDMVGERLFGADHWDEDFRGKSAVTTDELYTWLDGATVQPPDQDAPVAIHFLNQKHEFLYFFRVQNCAATAQTITARVWLVAKYDQAGLPLYNYRRMWIEMDTFQVCLPAHACKVICRPARYSSVVRKAKGAAVKAHDVLSGAHAHAGSESPGAYCDCGWPYNLLLPKGREKGMMFRLLVLFTKDDIKMPITEQRCGSVSLCGTRGEEYPDKQRMGYPFHRRFCDDTPIETLIFTQPTMAALDLRITHVR